MRPSFMRGAGEFILPYDAVRNAPDPDQTLLGFLETTYDAAARLGGWDRTALECRSRSAPACRGCSLTGHWP